ncbi:hypothetical protein J6A31_04980 [bacterium]|nr:hypothetical protein [bacterium]
MNYEHEFLIQHKDEIIENFASMCSRLINIVKERKAIDAYYLDRFYRFSMLIFRGEIAHLTDEFDELLYLIRNYWMHSLIQDDDKRRCCSYTQLYQMVMMIKQYYEDRDTERFVQSVTNDYLDMSELIMAIKNSPGITVQTLQKILSLPEHILMDKLLLLEKEEFIISRGTNKYMYFILSELGDILARNLSVAAKNNVS